MGTEQSGVLICDFLQLTGTNIEQQARAGSVGYSGIQDSSRVRLCMKFLESLRYNGEVMQILGHVQLGRAGRG